MALKVRTRSGWTDMLASRPIRARTKTDWILRTRRGEAKLELTRASGTSRHAVLAGRWVIGNRTLRAARWDVEVKGRRLVITTEPLRRGERLRAAVYATPNLSGPQPTGRASSSGDTVTASGLARAVVTTWSKPGKVTATL